MALPPPSLLGLAEPFASSRPPGQARLLKFAGTRFAVRFVEIPEPLEAAARRREAKSRALQAQFDSAVQAAAAGDGDGAEAAPAAGALQLVFAAGAGAALVLLGSKMSRKVLA